VRGATVHLDDEALVLVDEVDAVRANALLALGGREPVGGDELEDLRSSSLSGTPNSLSSRSFIRRPIPGLRWSRRSRM
jgi:hypothetical protein